MPGCKFKIGLLNLRDCKQPVSAHCGSCNRPICSEHSRSSEDENTLCLECYAQQAPEKESDDDVSYVEQRRDIYETSGFHGVYFGHTMTHYGSDDYEVFETDAGSFDEYDGDASEDDFSADTLSPEDFQDS